MNTPIHEPDWFAVFPCGAQRQREIDHRRQTERERKRVS